MRPAGSFQRAALKSRSTLTLFALPLVSLTLGVRIVLPFPPQLVFGKRLSAGVVSTPAAFPPLGGTPFHIHSPVRVQDFANLVRPAFIGSNRDQHLSATDAFRIVASFFFGNAGLREGSNDTTCYSADPGPTQGGNN